MWVESLIENLIVKCGKRFFLKSKWVSFTVKWVILENSKKGFRIFRPQVRALKLIEKLQKTPMSCWVLRFSLEGQRVFKQRGDWL